MLDNNYRCSKRLLDACQAQRHAAALRVVGGGLRRLRHVPRGARVRAAAQRLRLLEAAVRQRRAPHAADGARRAGRRLPLLQRLRPARAAQGPHGRRSRSTTSTSSAPSGKVKLFGDYGGYGPGEQTRDFVFVDDVVAVNLWFLEHPEASGIFNVGTGRAQPFNDVAAGGRQRGARARGEPRRRWPSSSAQEPDRVRPVPRRRWSASTSASPRPTSRACARAGCDHAFADVATGVARYVAALAAVATP